MSQLHLASLTPPIPPTTSLHRTVRSMVACNSKGIPTQARTCLHCALAKRKTKTTSGYKSSTNTRTPKHTHQTTALHALGMQGMLGMLSRSQSAGTRISQCHNTLSAPGRMSLSLSCSSHAIPVCCTSRAMLHTKLLYQHLASERAIMDHRSAARRLTMAIGSQRASMYTLPLVQLARGHCCAVAMKPGHGRGLPPRTPDTAWC